MSIKDGDKNKIKIKIFVPLLYAHSTTDKPIYEHAHKHNLNLKNVKQGKDIPLAFSSSISEC